jgi:hypothetical protein
MVGEIDQILTPIRKDAEGVFLGFHMVSQLLLLDRGD